MDNMKWYKLTQGSIYLYFHSEQLFWDSPAQLAFSKLQMCQRKMKTALVRRTFQRADDVRSAITRDDVSLPAIPGIGDDQQTLGFHLFLREEVDVVQECVPISGHSSRDHGVTAHSPDCDAPIRWPPPLPLSDKISMSESRNTNKSHCPPLCTWITGFLLHIFGDFISKAVWISLVGEISPIWPGACCASLIPDREGTHVNADSIFNARKDLIVAEKLKPIEG